MNSSRNSSGRMITSKIITSPRAKNDQFIAGAP